LTKGAANGKKSASSCKKKKSSVKGEVPERRVKGGNEKGPRKTSPENRRGREKLLKIAWERDLFNPSRASFFRKKGGMGNKKISVKNSSQTWRGEGEYTKKSMQRVSRQRGQDRLS